MDAPGDWAELASQALAETFLAFGNTMEQGWFRREGGVLAGVSGASLPTLNGVWVVGDELDPSLIDHLLDVIAAEGVPYCLQLRPVAGELHSVAERRGMVRLGELPLMVLDELSASRALGEVSDVTWLRVSPDQVEQYVEALARGFEAPVAAMAAFVTRRTLALAQLDCFLGLVSGEAVTTALAFTNGEATGIYNVATLAEHRGRGYGLAATAQCLSAASQRGARWAYLQSSEMGFSVYQRLGFRTVEQWQLWVSPT